MSDAGPSPEKEELDSALWEFLGQIEEWLETPMVVLGFIWLALLVAEILWGLGGFLQSVVLVIWGLFVLDFGLRFLLAPHKAVYLRRNWLTALSLAVPALRIGRLVQVARLARVARATQTVRLVSVVGSLNRGMRALRASMGRHGLQYILALTVLVILVGAAGMWAFESGPDGAQLGNYGEAIWWTAMLVTTIGSERWPATPQGRTLTLLLSVYAVGVLGYITAAIASFLVGRDAESDAAEVAGERSMRALREEVHALREELRALRSELQEANGGSDRRDPDRHDPAHGESTADKDG